MSKAVRRYGRRKVEGLRTPAHSRTKAGKPNRVFTSLEIKVVLPGQKGSSRAGAGVQVSLPWAGGLQVTMLAVGLSSQQLATLAMLPSSRYFVSINPGNSPQTRGGSWGYTYPAQVGRLR